jgi:hypothetical protein
MADEARKKSGAHSQIDLSGIISESRAYQKARRKGKDRVIHVLDETIPAEYAGQWIKEHTFPRYYIILMIILNVWKSSDPHKASLNMRG